MIAGILKVGTHPAYHFWLWGNKPLGEYKKGDKIKFREQRRNGSRWETGIVTGMKIDMPLVERF